MKVIGYAAPKIAKSLIAKGGRQVAPPEGFIVLDKEGPLRDGELERAAAWARDVVAAAGAA
jgi:flavodoxin I